MIHYRDATSQDLAHLRDLDLKCHEQSPSPAEWWTQIAENPNATCKVACQSHVPIGMAVWEQQAFRLPTFKSKVTTIHFHKLCVRSEFRGKKIAQRLLAYGHEAARANKCPYMSMSIPEYRCVPGEQDDVSQWLNSLHFKASIILPEKIQLYGRDYDQFLFIHEVKV